MPAPVPTRREAIAILEEGRARTLDLIAQVPRHALTTPGLGGGEWSPKDLLGHVGSWEEHALDALAAWEARERAPIEALFRSVTTTQINRQDVARKAPWPMARTRRDTGRTHGELIAALEALSDDRWERPATARARRPLGARLGAILGGPAGPFRHDQAHHSTLVTFADRHRRA